MINIRVVNESDFPDIDRLIAGRIWERTNKKWTELIDLQAVELVLKNKHPHIHTMVVEETYLVAFSISQVWFSGKRFVEEKIVLKLRNGTGKFSDVILALEHTARVTGIDQIIAGTLMASNDKALARMYQKGGFEISQTGLYKNIRNSHA